MWSIDCHVTNNLEPLPLFYVGDDLYGFLFPALLSLCLPCPAAFFQLQNHKLLHGEQLFSQSIGLFSSITWVHVCVTLFWIADARKRETGRLILSPVLLSSWAWGGNLSNCLSNRRRLGFFSSLLIQNWKRKVIWFVLKDRVPSE